MRALLKPQELYKLMVELLGNEAVSGSQLERALYEEQVTPAPGIMELWIQARPDVIVRPGNTSEVARVITTAAEQEIPVIPHGRGTWARGGSVPINGGIVVDTRRLDHVKMDLDNHLVHVGAGVTWSELTAKVEEHHMLLPGSPSHSPDSTVGGWISAGGEGYGGQPRIRSLTAVNPQGEVMTTGPAMVQAGGVGYNLAQLLWGAEGTLGVITEATLGLVPAPAVEATAWAAPDLSQAAKIMVLLSRAGLSAFHLGFNDGKFTQFMPDGEALGSQEAVVMPIFAGQPEVVAAQVASAEKLLKDNGAWRIEEQGQSVLWKSRFTRPTAKHSYFRAGVLYIPSNKAADALVGLAELEGSMGQILLKHGHVVDPNTLALSVWAQSDEPGRQKVVLLGLAKKLSDLAFRVGGVPAGLGLWTMANLPRLHPPATLRFMRELKQALDPQDLLNPGKFVEVFTRDDFPVPPLALNVGNEVVARLKMLWKR